MKTLEIFTVNISDKNNSPNNAESVYTSTVKK
jgi:hypothetical protein